MRHFVNQFLFMVACLTVGFLIGWSEAMKHCGH